MFFGGAAEIHKKFIGKKLCSYLNAQNVLIVFPYYTPYPFFALTGSSSFLAMQLRDVYYVTKSEKSTSRWRWFKIDFFNNSDRQLNNESNNPRFNFLTQKFDEVRLNKVEWKMKKKNAILRIM